MHVYAHSVFLLTEMYICHKSLPVVSKEISIMNQS